MHPNEVRAMQYDSILAEVNKLRVENTRLREALEHIRYSALSQGVDGDDSTADDHLLYSLRLAREALDV